jgi:hypothetical protein
MSSFAVLGSAAVLSMDGRVFIGARQRDQLGFSFISMIVALLRTGGLSFDVALSDGRNRDQVRRRARNSLVDETGGDSFFWANSSSAAIS